MVFSSPLFLFLFLPVVLAAYFLVPRLLRQTVLLIASLLFYAWSSGAQTAILLVSIAANYLFGLAVGPSVSERNRRIAIAVAVTANLAMLGYYKYFAFFLTNLLPVLGSLGFSISGPDAIELPIGISFYTFHALSYVLDVYRREVPPQKNPLLLGLYITLFPQLIAGPIVRYHEVNQQIEKPAPSWERFLSGVGRFILGLGKKAIIANGLGEIADKVFAIDAGLLSTPAAWIGIACYTFQIYFDFSGYSDMAIGLARMLGIGFPENFRYPYVARSITEFWRRWHISLSSWFRDYLYIPLGGNRVSAGRTILNLYIVFFLCGLWHGASWNFILWGLVHGTGLMLERVLGNGRIERMPGVVRHLYTLLFVVVGWVFFRAETLPAAVGFLQSMAGLQPAAEPHMLASWLLDREVVLFLTLAVVGSTPLLMRINDRMTRRLPAGLSLCIQSIFLTVVFAYSVLRVSGYGYNPFIYFRF